MLPYARLTRTGIVPYARVCCKVAAALALYQLAPAPESGASCTRLLTVMAQAIWLLVSGGRVSRSCNTFAQLCVSLRHEVPVHLDVKHLKLAGGLCVLAVPAA